MAVSAKNGETFPAEVILTAYPLGGEMVLQSTVRDIEDWTHVLDLRDEERTLELIRREKERQNMICTHKNIL